MSSLGCATMTLVLCSSLVESTISVGDGLVGPALTGLPSVVHTLDPVAPLALMSYILISMHSGSSLCSTWHVTDGGTLQ